MLYIVIWKHMLYSKFFSIIDFKVSITHKSDTFHHQVYIRKLIIFFHVHFQQKAINAFDQRMYSSDELNETINYHQLRRINAKMIIPIIKLMYGVFELLNWKKQTAHQMKYFHIDS